MPGTQDFGFCHPLPLRQKECSFLRAQRGKKQTRCGSRGTEWCDSFPMAPVLSSSLHRSLMVLFECIHENAYLWRASIKNFEFCTHLGMEKRASISDTHIVRAIPDNGQRALRAQGGKCFPWCSPASSKGKPTGLEI